MNIATIAWRELRNLFITPLGWIILALTQMTQGIIFYQLLQSYQQFPATTGDQAGISYHVASLSLASSAYIALLIVPILTMFQIAGERRQGSFRLLYSAPISTLDIVLGKFFGVCLFLCVVMLVVSLMPLSLLVSNPLDVGLLMSAFVGIMLLLASYCALGIFVSSLTANPVIAGVGTLFVLISFWLMELPNLSSLTFLHQSVAYLSLFRHLDPLLHGVLDSRDIIYFILFITLFLAMAIFFVERDKTVI